MAAAAAASPRTPGGPGGDDPDRTSWLYEDDELVSTFLKTTGSSGMSYQHADIKRFCTILRSLDVDRDAIRRAYDVFVVTCPTIIQPPENLFWSIREEEERLAREEYERALEMGLKVPKPKAKAKAKKDKGMPTTAKGIQRYVTKGITADDLISRFKKHEKGAADELRQDIWTYYQSLFTAEEDSWILENCSSFTEAKPKEFLEHCRNSLGRLLDSGVPSGLLDIPEKSAITSEQLQERSESLKKEAPNRFQLLSRQSTLDSHFPLREGEKRVCDVPALRQLLQGFYEMKLGLEALGNPATAAAAAATGVKGKGQQKGAVQSGKRNSKEGANASQGTHTEGRRRSSDGSGVDGSQAVGGPPNVDSILTGGMDKPNADMTSKSLYPADHRFEADGTLKGAAAAGGGGEGDGEAGDADADGDADAASVFTFCSGSDTSAAEWLRILDPEMLAWLSQGSKKMSVEVPRYGQKGRTAVITCPFELVCEQSPRLARLYRRALERKAQLQAEEDNDPVEAAAHKGARDEESEVEFEDVDDIPLHMGSVYEAQLHNLNERERQELRVQCKEVVKFVLRKHKSLGEAFGALGIKDGTELDLQMFVEAVSVWGISKQFCERVFSLMDVDRSGTLSLPEISQFFHDLVANNVDVPRISLVEQFRTIDKLNLLRERLLVRFGTIARAFDHFDLTRNTMVDLEEFQNAMLRIKIHPDEAAEFFSKVDMNGSGNVNVWEFKSALERFDPPKLQGESDVMAQFRMRVLEQFSTVDGAFEAFAAAGDRETGLKRRDFFKALKRLQMSLSKDEANMVFRLIDSDNSKEIDPGEFMAALGNSHFRRAVDGCPAFISDEFFKRFLGFVRAPEASFVVTRLRDLKKSLDGILEKVSKAVRVEVKKEFEAYGQRLADLEAQAINRSVEEVNRHMAAILQTIERQRQSLLEAFSVHVRALAQLHRMKLQECYQAETFQWRQRLLKFSEGLHKLLEHAIDDEGKATKAVIPEGGDLVLFLLLTDWLECKRLKDFLLRQLVKEFDALAFDEVWQREETAKAMGPLFMKEIVSRIPAETLLRLLQTWRTLDHLGNERPNAAKSLLRSDAGDGGLLLDALTPDRFEFKWSLGPLVLQELKQRRHLAREVYTGWGTDMLLSAKYNKLVAFRGELEHVIRERRRTAGPVKLKSEGAASDVEIFRGKAKLLTNRKYVVVTGTTFKTGVVDSFESQKQKGKFYYEVKVLSMPPGLFNEEDEKEQRASDEEGQERSGKEGQTDPTKGGGGAQSVSLRTLQTSENIAWGTLTIGWDVARHSRHLSHAIPGCEDPYGVTTVQKHSMLGCSLSSDGLVHGYGQGLEASRRPQKGDTVGVLLDQQSATVIFHVNGKLVHSPSSRHAADPPWRTASKTNAVSSLPVGSSARFDIPNSSGYVLIPTVTLFQHLPGWYDPKSVEGVEDLAVREEEAEKQEGVRSAKHEIHRSRPPVCQVAINYTGPFTFDPNQLGVGAGWRPLDPSLQLMQSRKAASGTGLGGENTEAECGSEGGDFEEGDAD